VGILRCDSPVHVHQSKPLIPGPSEPLCFTAHGKTPHQCPHFAPAPTSSLLQIRLTMCLQSCERCLDMWRYCFAEQSRSFEPLFSAQNLESATVSAFFLRPLLLALAGPHGDSPQLLRISDGPVQISFPLVPPTFQPTFLRTVLRIHACGCIQVQSETNCYYNRS